MTTPTTVLDLRWYLVREYDRGRPSQPSITICPTCWAEHGHRFPERSGVPVGRFQRLTTSITRVAPSADYECHFCNQVPKEAA